ncbi:MAG: zinc-ribbon domain-containing protein, partial [Spirochaetia bacterium]|nr:zinc-ribbon domain-containing protein [Spirochaetia bacterium]
TNCPRCARMKGAEKRRETLIERHGSVAEVAPQLVAEWDYEKNDITPEVVSASSYKRVWWK